MTVRRMSVLIALVAVLVTAGCARGDDAGSGPSTPGSAAPGSGAPESPVPGVPESGVPTNSPAKPPADSAAQTLSGTVTAGVEPNCLLLAGGGKEHLLIFDDETMKAAAKVGTQVTVEGREQPDMMTTCMQGTPFLVTSVRAS